MSVEMLARTKQVPDDVAVIVALDEVSESAQPEAVPPDAMAKVTSPDPEEGVADIKSICE